MAQLTRDMLLMMTHRVVACPQCGAGIGDACTGAVVHHERGLEVLSLISAAMGWTHRKVTWGEAIDYINALAIRINCSECGAKVHQIGRCVNAVFCQRLDIALSGAVGKGRQVLKL